MRTYTFTASRPGGFMFWPSKVVTSHAKIRAVVIVLFRKWFGREPNFHWHKDGFMAEAWDERGNHITVEQDNPGYVEKVRPRRWLKNFRWASRNQYHSTAAMWHAKLLEIPALPPIPQSAIGDPHLV